MISSEELGKGITDSSIFIYNPSSRSAIIKRWSRFSLEKIMSMRSDAPEAQRQFYDSVAWKKCRAEYRKSVGNLCERCKAKGLIEPGYIVHHKHYVDAHNINDPNVLLSWDNLELLCQNCHNAEHNRKKKRFTIDELGRVIC